MSMVYPLFIWDALRPELIYPIPVANYGMAETTTTIIGRRIRQRWKTQSYRIGMLKRHGQKERLFKGNGQFGDSSRVESNLTFVLA